MTLAKNRKLRIIIDGIHVYVTVGKVSDTFAHTGQRIAVLQAIHRLENATPPTNGLVADFNGFQVQVDAL